MALDPTIIAMTKAIRQHETGNRPIAGATGELVSRYQYMPSTWKSWAKQYLGNENAPLTLENENKVAYSRVADWKKQGLSDEQIFAAWNAGEAKAKSGAWKTNQGTNNGVAYDTKAYVDKVMANYRKFQNESVVANAQGNAAVSPNAEGVDGEIAKNPDAIARGVAKVASAVAPLGESIGSALGTFGAKKYENEVAQRNVELSSVAIGLIRNKNLSPEQRMRALRALQMSQGTGVVDQSGAFNETAKQTFGKGLQTLGSVLAGSGAAAFEAGGAAAPLALQGAKKIGAQALSEGLIAGGTQGVGSMLENDGTFGEAARTGAMAAAIQAAVPLVGRGAWEVYKRVAGPLSGRPAAAMQHLFDTAKNNPEFGAYFFNKMAREADDKTATAIIEKVQDAAQVVKDQRDTAYRTAREEISKLYEMGTDGQLRVLNPETGKYVVKSFSLNPVKAKLNETLNKFDIRVARNAKTGRISLDFANSPSFRNDKARQSAVRQLVTDLYTWKDFTPLGLDRLEATISEGFTNLATETGQRRLNSIIMSAKAELRKHVNEILPEIGKMKNQYSDASRAMERISRDLAVPMDDTKSVRTGITRLSNIFNPRSEYYRELVKELGEKTSRDLLTDIAVQNFKGWVPEGLGRYFSSVGAVTGNLGSAAAAGVAGAPRIVGNTAVLGGRAARALGTQEGQTVVSQLRNLALNSLGGGAQ